MYRPAGEPIREEEAAVNEAANDILGDGGLCLGGYPDCPDCRVPPAKRQGRHHKRL